jgi:hypothetical protein
MHLRTIVIAVFAVLLAFGGATLALRVLEPGIDRPPPALAVVPPLPPVSRNSTIVAPAAIALTAIRDAMEQAAPRDLSGKRGNLLAQVLSNAELGWTVGRDPLAVTGRPDALVISTALNGTLRATGKLAPKTAGRVGKLLGGLLGQDVGRDVQTLASQAIDQRADIRGNVTVTGRPLLTAAWRLEPNLTAQVSVADVALSLAGQRLSLANEVRPMLERTVDEDVRALQARLRSDPFLEQAVRKQWAKLCHSFRLGAAAPGLPDLWLELRPTRAFAAQPRFDAAALTLTLGMEAQTRIVPSETKPDCPFPATLEIVPPLERGRVNIAVPIDVPFTEVNRLIAAQLTGKTFPQDQSSAVSVLVRRASVAPSGDRLLISLRVKANETTSWFGLGTEATIHIWGKPTLDREQQVMRLTDIALDVESEGVLGAAARAAAPYLKAALAENGVIDLKPFIANARKSIETAIADFRGGAEGVRVDATVNDLRLAEIAFDAQTLRLIAEAEGTAQVAVTSLPGR